jgi:hypothetical protein
MLLMVKTALKENISWKKRVKIFLIKYQIFLFLSKNIICGTLNNLFNKKQVKHFFLYYFLSLIFDLVGKCRWKIIKSNY